MGKLINTKRFLLNIRYFFRILFFLTIQLCTIIDNRQYSSEKKKLKINLI